MKNFVKSVVDSLDVGLGSRQNRIGVIQFGKSARTEFDLSTYSNKTAIKAAIDKISYLEEDTCTHSGIDLLVFTFTQAHGARSQDEGHPWIGVVLTDGYSNYPNLTAASAKGAHAADITMVAVGIGSGAYKPELNTIASNPVCLHVILLSDFSEVSSLNYIIEQRACNGEFKSMRLAYVHYSCH